MRSRARYRTSLDVLRYLSEKGAVAKSGLMVGLGESDEEVLQTLRDLHAAGVEIVTLGQYLRPTLEHHPVAAYITPENSTGTGSRRSTWASATARAVRWCVRRTWRTKRSARCV